MKSQLSWLVVTLLAALISCGDARGEGPEAVVRGLTTKDGVRFGIWPAAPKEPAPTLFILASSIEETLGNEYFRQCGNELAKRGYLCVSVDLPGHGLEVREGEPAGIAAWRARCEKDEDFVVSLTSRLSKVVDHLIAEKMTDAAKIAACGTSRGGYSALQFAAAEPRVKCVAAFAPVTELGVLREFKGAETNAMVQKLSVERRAADLAGRAVWLVIGDRDERVGTDDTIRLARMITAEALRQKRPALVELHVFAEPAGHTTPAGSAALAAEWIDKQIKLP